MSLSKAITAYPDVERVLDVILAQGAGSIAFDNPKKAAAFRARIYQFRRLLRLNNPDGTIYDSVALQIRDRTLYLTPIMDTIPELVLTSGAEPLTPAPKITAKQVENMDLPPSVNDALFDELFGQEPPEPTDEGDDEFGDPS
jgi:hypothetical protein